MAKFTVTNACQCLVVPILAISNTIFKCIWSWKGKERFVIWFGSGSWGVPN